VIDHAMESQQFGVRLTPAFLGGGVVAHQILCLE
jgi:hypothetical protein